MAAAEKLVVKFDAIDNESMKDVEVELVIPDVLSREDYEDEVFARYKGETIATGRIIYGDDPEICWMNDHDTIDLSGADQIIRDLCSLESDDEPGDDAV